MLSLKRRFVGGFQLGAALLIIVLLVHWGGTARPGPLFVAGVALLLSLMLTFGLLAWWLFFSPLPISSAKLPPRPRIRQLRQMVVLFVLMTDTLFSSGMVWDEVWHRKFGVFGNDFLWPPHLMIYGSLALTALFAGISLLVLAQGVGDIRQRFRREPLIGLLALVAAYLIVSLPLDQLWHQIYGKDITAWSLPHLTIMAGNVMILLAAVTIQRSLLPHGSRNLAQERIILLLICLTTNTLLQIGTLEWEGITRIPTGNTSDVFRQAFWDRPEWLYPVVVITIALLIGMLVLSVLRRAGTATIVAFLTIGLHTAQLTLFDGWAQGATMTSYVLILPPMIALDIWYALRVREQGTNRTIIGGALIAGVVGLLIGLPVIMQTMVYPRINSTTLPGIVLFGLMMAVFAGWTGVSIGSWMTSFSQQSTQEVNAWAGGSHISAVS